MLLVVSKLQMKPLHLVIVGGIVGIVLWLLIPTATSTNDLVRQGKSALARGRFAQAVEFAERAVKQSPESASAWWLLTESAYFGGHSDRAVAALNEWSRYQPDSAQKFSVQIGSELMKQNRVRLATAFLRCAADSKTLSPAPYRLLAQIHAVTGHLRDAQHNLLELVRRKSFTHNDLLLLTSQNAFISDPKHIEAMLQVDTAEKSPVLASALNALGLNDLQKAEACLIEVIAANPEDMEAQGFLGELYADSESKRFTDWHEQLPRSAEVDSRIWLARAKWLRQRGELRSAVRCFHEAVVLEPELLSATIPLGQVLTTLGERELGSEWTERGRLLQRILDLTSRMKEVHAQQWIGPLIDDLEAAGQLWEAWGWSLIETQSFSRSVEAAERRDRLASLLQTDLPRTKTKLPGEGADWDRFPLPERSLFQNSEYDRRLALPAESKIHFENMAESVGLDFRFANSFTSEAGRRIYESMGAGVAVLDYDRDGWPDLYFPQGKPLPLESSEGPSDALYRNRFGERFELVSREAEIHETSYSQGVAAGDFDNDGFPDLYVANIGRNRLYRNLGDGTFSDVTTDAGLKQDLWTASCAMADLNGDGFPELFDVNYLQGKEFLTRTCVDQNGHPTVCRPTVFDPALDTVAINLGDGRFQQQQAEAGLDLPQGMGLGIIVADFNEDNRLDVFIANDQTANYLLINEPSQPLRFHDEAHLRGVALDLNGLAQACMGVACADINRDHLPDLFVTNFAKESNTLYQSSPGGFYVDATQSADLRAPSFDPLGFGTQFLDADCDGWYDLVVVNGHIDEFQNTSYRMKPQFFQGQSDGRFQELQSENVGRLFGEPRLGRSLAVVDWNRDGLRDFVSTDLESSIVLATNRSNTKHHSLRLRLIGTLSSRDAIGAKVKVLIAPGSERTIQLTAGDGYQASNERVIEIGLGLMDHVESLEIRWPSGVITRWNHVSADEDYVAIEGHEELQLLRR